MYVVVAGEDEVAYRISAQLMHNHDVVFIAPEGHETVALDHLDLEVVVGSLTSVEVLRAARTQNADLFIATTPNDEKNIVGCIAARRLGAAQTILFLTRRTYDRAAGVDSEIGLAESLGIDAVVRPSQHLAEEILRIVTVPGALDVRTFVGGRVQLLKFEVSKGSPVAKAPLKKIALPPGVLLVMGRRGDEFYIPKGDTHLEPGDKITAVGTRHGIRRLNRLLLKSDKSQRRRRAFVIGGGLVGTAVARGLVEAGWRVKLVEVNANRCEEIAGVLDCLVLNGDGSDISLLEQEQVSEASALVAVTSNDEKNLLVSLLGKHLGVPRIITRADKLVNERLFEKVGIDVVLSARGAAIRWVVHDLIQADGDYLAELEHGDFRVLEVVLPSSFLPISLFALRPPEFTIVGAILRKGRALIPKGRQYLKPLDKLLVFSTSDGAKKTLAFFEELGRREAAESEA